MGPPGWWLYYRLIPSIVSFVAAFLILGNVYLVGRQRQERKYYHHLSAAFAVADIIQTLSWIIGPKFDEPFVQCSIQEYMFQFGSLGKTLVMAVISWSVWEMLRTMKPFAVSPRFAICSVIGVSILVSISIAAKTSSVVCGNDADSIDLGSNGNGSHLSRSVYIFAFIVPIIICAVVNIVFTVVCAVIAFRVRPSMMMTFLRPLLPYPIIFSLALAPAFTYLIYVVATGQENASLEALAGLGISCCGIFYALAYFSQLRESAIILKSSNNNRPALVKSRFGSNTEFFSVSLNNTVSSSSHASEVLDLEREKMRIASQDF